MTATTPRLRDASYDRRLIPVQAVGARARGAEVSLIELRAIPVPRHAGDIEAAGKPGNVLVAARAAA